MHDTAAQLEGQHTDLRVARVNSVRRCGVGEPRPVWSGVLEDRFCEAAPHALDAHAELLDRRRERDQFSSVRSRRVRCIWDHRAGLHAQRYVQLGSRVISSVLLYSYCVMV